MTGDTGREGQATKINISIEIAPDGLHITAEYTAAWPASYRRSSAYAPPSRPRPHQRGASRRKRAKCPDATDGSQCCPKSITSRCARAGTGCTARPRTAAPSAATAGSSPRCSPDTARPWPSWPGALCFACIPVIQSKRESLRSRLALASAEELATLPGVYAPPTGRLLLARQDGQPAGCICLKGHDATTSELKRLYVNPTFRGQ